MKRVAFALTPILLLSLAACSTEHDPRPRFETHVFGGSFKYLGDPIALYASNAHYTTVKMPFPIRGLAPRYESAIKIAIDEDKLSVRATDRLTDQGEKITVHLLDGRAMPMIVYPKSKEPIKAEFQSPLPEITTPAVARARLAPSAALANFDDIINRVKNAERSNQPLQGYTPSQKLGGTLAINSQKLRAIFEKSYIGRDFTVHILSVENLFSSPLQLTREHFKFKGLQAIAFDSATLEAKGYGSHDDATRTRAYVVVTSAIQ